MSDDLPHVYPTVVHMLADAEARAPDALALKFDGRKLTYREFARCVGGLAAELQGQGAGAERVALICGNSLEMAVALCAIHAAGAQAVPLNPLYTARELGHMIEDSAPTVIIHDVAVTDTVAPLAIEFSVPHLIAVGEGGRLFDGWRDDDGVALPQPLPEPENFASLQYTGGTTGLPKGVQITHSQLAVNVSQREALMPTRADDEVVLCVMPLFHVFAITFLHLAIYCRGSLVILARYHPEEVLAAIEREGITRLPAGPTIYIGLMAHENFGTTDFSKFRTAYSGSAPLPVETLIRWREKTNSPILEGYGMSEAGPVISFMDEREELIPGSVGKPLPQTEIEIVDVETGNKVLGVGERGEIRVRGPQVMSGYRNKPQETAQALRGGWLYTGDIGEFDESGNLYIRDRKKDMAIVGGYNVYPREIDEVLYGHPDVQEAAAVGLPDDYRGEIIRAFVVLTEGATADAEAIQDYCRDNLAKYKVPATVDVVDQLPNTTVVKIDKLKLRKNAAEQA
jgi:long-chain acyl-CoA synthetase